MTSAVRTFRLRARKAADSVARWIRHRFSETRQLLAGAIVAWSALGAYSRLGTRYSLDLLVYRQGATALRAGHNPYLDVFTKHHLAFTYPPFALLVFLPLSLASDPAIEITWWLINAASIIAILFLLMTMTKHFERRLAYYRSLFLAPVLCFALEPLRSNLDYGQINAILLLAIFYDLWKVQPSRRGILVGLAAAVKLTPAIFVLYFILSRDGRAAIRSASSFVVATALTFAVLPSESLRFWSSDATQPGRTGSVRSPLNQSLYGVLHRWPVHHFHEALWLAAVAAVLIAGSLLVKSLLQRQQSVAAATALGLTGELVSPISWSHHWIWIVAIPFLLIQMTRDQNGTATLGVMMLAVVVVACLAPYTWKINGWMAWIDADSLVGLGVALLVTWTVTEVRRRPLTA